MRIPKNRQPPEIKSKICKEFLWIPEVSWTSAGVFQTRWLEHATCLMEWSSTGGYWRRSKWIDED